jgi:hypothetical protein
MNAVAQHIVPTVLWRIAPNDDGTFTGLGKTRGGRLVSITSESRDLIQQNLVEMQLQLSDNAEERFLAAWKRGIKLAGRDLFHIKAVDLASADSKEKLPPNWEAVEAYIRGACSDAERLFLMEMCSFYNNEWMEEQKAAIELPRSSFCRAAYSLDEERGNVLADLLTAYRGW